MTAVGGREHDAHDSSRSREEGPEQHCHHAEEGRVARPSERARRHKAGPLLIQADAPGRTHLHLGGKDDGAAREHDRQAQPCDARTSEHGDQADGGVEFRHDGPSDQEDQQGAAADPVDPSDEVVGYVARTEPVGRAPNTTRHLSCQQCEGNADDDKDHDRKPGRRH
jgi:hypothetical protein